MLVELNHLLTEGTWILLRLRLRLCARALPPVLHRAEPLVEQARFVWPHSNFTQTAAMYLWEESILVALGVFAPHMPSHAHTITQRRNLRHALLIGALIMELSPSCSLC